MKLLPILLSLVIATPALAAFVFSPNVGYYSQEREETLPADSSYKTTELRLDARIGYILPMGLYVGGMYASTNSDDGTTNNGGSMIGPTIGYYSMMGFYSLFTYHIIGELEEGVSKYTGAQGPQADIGWIFPISSFFAIGPQLTWRSIEYDKLETAGVSVESNRKDTSIAPYVSLWFMF